MKTPCDKLAKIYTNCSGHMTKMVNMPIHLLKNQKAHDLGTWYVSIGDVGPAIFVQIIILG